MDSGSRLFVLRAFALASSSLSTRQEDVSLKSPFQMVLNLAHHLSQLYQLQLLKAHQPQLESYDSPDAQCSIGGERSDNKPEPRRLRMLHHWSRLQKLP